MDNVKIIKRDCFISFFVPIPADTVETPFIKYCRKKHCGNIALLKLSINNEIWMLENFRKHKNYFPWNDKCVVFFVHHFYNFVYDKSSQSNNDEKLRYKGLGKQLMVAFIQWIEKNMNVNLENNFIVLEASGQVGNNEKKYITQYQWISCKNLLWEIFQNFPMELTHMDSLPQDSTLHQSLLDIIISCKVCEELIHYYHHTYGFELWQLKPSNGALMGSSLYNIKVSLIDSCSFAQQTQENY